MPGKPHSEEARNEAITLSQVLDSSNKAGAELGIPSRTIRTWVAEFKLMGDSELEAFVAEQKRLATGLWAVEQIASLEFAGQLREIGKAGDYRNAMVAAGICDTKLTTMGQPKTINQPSSGTANPLIVTPPDKGG